MMATKILFIDKHIQLKKNLATVKWKVTVSFSTVDQYNPFIDPSSSISAKYKRTVRIEHLISGSIMANHPYLCSSGNIGHWVSAKGMIISTWWAYLNWIPFVFWTNKDTQCWLVICDVQILTLALVLALKTNMHHSLWVSNVQDAISFFPLLC